MSAERREWKFSDQQNRLLTILLNRAVKADVARCWMAYELNAAEQNDELCRQIQLAWARLSLLRDRNEDTTEATREWERSLEAYRALLGTFDRRLHSHLKEGRLLAFAVSRPVLPTSHPCPMSAAQWLDLVVDFGRAEATGTYMSYTDVRVVFVDKLNAEVRAMLDDAVALFARLETEFYFTAMKLQQAREQRQAVATPDIMAPVPVVLVGANDRVVLKTETLRRNTRYGKPEPVFEDSACVDDSRLRPRKRSAPSDPVPPPEARRRPGPWSAIPLIEVELIRRHETKQLKDTWQEECAHLLAWARKNIKRDEKTRTPDAPSLKTIRQSSLANKYYELNPESDRRSKFRLDSSQA